MKKLDFVFFDAGGGHRTAANALKEVIEGQNRNWKIRMVNLQEVLDSLDLFRKVTGVRGEDVYNKMLKRGWTYRSDYLLPLMHGLIRAYHKEQRQKLTEFWTGNQPDLVVSLIPNFNRALFEGLESASPATPLVTILTDLADLPPHFWMEEQDQYLICGTEKAIEQARQLGYPPQKLFLASGMILRPLFYKEFVGDRGEERERLGLRAETPTGLILFGGQGSSVMLDIAERLQQTRLDVQLIFLCGHNEKLAGELREMKSRLPFGVVGFTNEVPYYMRLSDFFIGKPGPGSISEALAMKLPVLVARNSFTLPQERYNAEWVEEKGVGMVLPSFRQITAAVDELLEADVLARYQATAAAIKNRAVFEIPDILARILNGAK